MRPQYHDPRVLYPTGNPTEPGKRSDGRYHRQFRAGRLTAEDLLVRYCSHVFNQCGNYAEMARRLEIDRRTAKSKVSEDWCRRLDQNQE